MAKNNSSKTILIIVAVIVGILLIGGIIAGISCNYLYKVGTETESKNPPDEWVIKNTYTNARFGFSFRYPKTFIAAESQNGDGISLTLNPPGISVNAYAAANSQNITLNEYLNDIRADLFKGAENAEEITARDTQLGEIAAQERQWKYLNPIDSTETIMDQVTALKGENFYTVQMIIANTDYSQYLPIFEEILGTYKFK